jgi:hypothetical protein
MDPRRPVAVFRVGSARDLEHLQDGRRRRRDQTDHEPADGRLRHHRDESRAVGRRLARRVQRLRGGRVQHLRPRQRQPHLQRGARDGCRTQRGRAPTAHAARGNRFQLPAQRGGRTAGGRRGGVVSDGALPPEAAAGLPRSTDGRRRRGQLRRLRGRRHLGFVQRRARQSRRGRGREHDEPLRRSRRLDRVPQSHAPVELGRRDGFHAVRPARLLAGPRRRRPRRRAGSGGRAARRPDRSRVRGDRLVSIQPRAPSRVDRRPAADQRQAGT